MHAARANIEPEPIVLLAVVGERGEALTGTIEALYTERDLIVREAFVIVDREGLERIHSDVLDSGRALDRLRATVGEELLDHHSFHLQIARRPNGDILEDDSHPADARCFRETLWRAARDAIAVAGARPVVFALLQGVRRSATALETAFFQLLAREGDLLLETRGDLENGRRVRLIELDLPRFAGVLEGTVLTDLESAKNATRGRAERAPPELCIDLTQGWVEIDGIEVDLSPAERLWYAYLAWRRSESTDGWVLVGQDGHEELLSFLRRAGARRRTSSIRSKPLRELLEAESVDDEDLRNLRGKTVQRMKRWCAAHNSECARLLVPETDGNGHQRIALPAHRIQLRGLPPVR